MKRFVNDWRILLPIALFLGFAPFVPEPHLFGKVRWVAGGAVGMQPMDWFDLVWHAWPFALLLRLGILRLRGRYVPS